MSETEDGNGNESLFKDGAMWDADRSRLEDKLSEYYDVDQIWYDGHWYHEEKDEHVMEALLYFDGNEEHFIADEVPMHGHGPSGAVGVKKEDLPPKEDVQKVVEEVEA